MKIARISPTTTARNSTPSKTRHSEKRDCVLDFRVLDFRFPNNNSPIPSPNNVTGSAHTASVNHSPALLGWRGQDITSRLNAAIPLNARYQAMKRRSLMKSAGCRVDCMIQPFPITRGDQKLNIQTAKRLGVCVFNDR